MTDEREDFASRWSRLKRRKAAQPEERAPEQGKAPAPAADDRPDEQVLKELGLPDPDTLKPGDDFSAFMAAAVPARLRNRALRRLWGSRPVFANLDRLVDYDEDYTDAATVPEVLRTAYKVGRGWLEGEEAKPPPEQGKADLPQAAEPVPAEDAKMPSGPATVGTRPCSGEGKVGGTREDVADTAEQPPTAAAGRGGTGAPHKRARMRFRFTDE